MGRESETRGPESFIAALKQEAEDIISEVQASVDAETLIAGVKEQLQALAPSDDGTDERTDEQIGEQVRQTLIEAAYATRKRCVRCGTCCRAGSPTLVHEDFNLFTKEIVSHEDLFTIREGEIIYSSMEERAWPATEELIKIREKPDAKTCLFLDEAAQACRIYDDRPAQCRAQECWNPESAREAANKAHFNRYDILRSTGVLWDIIARHEEHCSYEEFNRAMARLSATKGQTVQEVLDMLSYDQHVRDFMVEKFNVTRDSLEFFLGRPLSESLGRYGLKVEPQPDGSVMLTPIEAEDSEGGEQRD